MKALNFPGILEWDYVSGLLGPFSGRVHTLGVDNYEKFT